jgi:Ni,Fe-hydrogenase III large subunit
MTKTVIPFGPQHPVLPEPLQFKLTLQDEKVVDALPAIGYVHRGIEKAAELNEYPQNVFLVERICGICSFIHALCYCQGIEQLMNVEVPARAKYLRVIWGELHRLHSHHLWLGLFADAFGFESLFMQIWRNREAVMDVLEKTAGNRVIISTCSIGGVRRDISDIHLAEIEKTLNRVESELNSVMPVMLEGSTVKHRTVGKGILSAEQVRQLGAVGPVARASGVAEDMRMLGYAAYSELGFEPVVETSGDSYARAKVRVRECYQSIELIRRAIRNLPGGNIATKVTGNPNGQIVTRVEQPRGELLYFIAGNGTRNLARMRTRTPTFANIPTLLAMLPGCDFADVPVITLSIDPCISCTDR